MTKFKKGDRVYIVNTGYWGRQTCRPGTVSRVMKTFVEVKERGIVTKFTPDGSSLYPYSKYRDRSVSVEHWTPELWDMAAREKESNQIQREINEINLMNRDRLSKLSKSEFKDLAIAIAAAAELARKHTDK